MQQNGCKSKNRIYYQTVANLSRAGSLNTKTLFLLRICCVSGDLGPSESFQGLWDILTVLKEPSLLRLQLLIVNLLIEHIHSDTSF